MNTVIHLLCGCTINHKTPHLVKLLCGASFESTGIMEYKAWVALEYKLMLNIMMTTLETCRIYLVSLPVEDLRLICRVADPLEDGSFTCICSTHDQNSEALNIFHVFISHLRIEAVGRLRRRSSFSLSGNWTSHTTSGITSCCIATSSASHCPSRGFGCGRGQVTYIALDKATRTTAARERERLEPLFDTTRSHINVSYDPLYFPVRSVRRVEDHRKGRHRSNAGRTLDRYQSPQFPRMVLDTRVLM
ncbi:hypothetical protein F5141DRAFT_1108640 [Pisolithus sp. B1]|nr:hypothetical protein F5141DRAFT_1108640 [Pisolithus sp. B1]